MLDRIKDILDPPLNAHRIFFFHIAKCGGTSIGQAIESAYKPWRPGQSEAVFRLDERAVRFAEENSLGSGNDVRRDLLNYAMSLPKTRCAIGHFHFSNAAFEQYRKEWCFVTVLRSPVERWLSHYSYNKDSGSRFSIDMPLEQFVDTELAASFGRAFADEVTDDLDKSELPIGTIVDLAVSRYKDFAVVGAIEDTRGFADKFRARFGHELQVKRLNVTSAEKRVSAGAIRPDLLRRITELCEPDLQVYERVLGTRPQPSFAS